MDKTMPAFIAGLLMLLLMVGSAAVAQAQSAWLIWNQSTIVHDNRTFLWEVHDATDSKEACLQRLPVVITKHIETAKTINPNDRYRTDAGEMWRAVFVEVPGTPKRYKNYYLCLPVGVDPNKTDIQMMLWR